MSEPPRGRPFPQCRMLVGPVGCRRLCRPHKWWSFPYLAQSMCCVTQAGVCWGLMSRPAQMQSAWWTFLTLDAAQPRPPEHAADPRRGCLPPRSSPRPLPSHRGRDTVLLCSCCPLKDPLPPEGWHLGLVLLVQGASTAKLTALFCPIKSRSGGGSWGSGQGHQWTLKRDGCHCPHSLAPPVP